MIISSLISIKKSRKERFLVHVRKTITRLKKRKYTCHNIPFIDLVISLKGSLPPENGKKKSSLEEKKSFRNYYITHSLKKRKHISTRVVTRAEEKKEKENKAMSWYALV